MTKIYYAIKPPNKSPDNNFNTNPLFNMLDEQLIPLYKDLKQEQDKKAQESPSTLLAELNTKMAQLIKLQAQTTTNTYEAVMATKGLNKNGFK